MEVQTPPGLCEEIQRQAERTNRQENAGAVAGKTEKTVMAEIDAHLRTGLRIIIWKQWKELKKRQWGLQEPGIGKDPARSCQKRCWRGHMILYGI